MTGPDFEHAATPVTWSFEFRGIADHVLTAIAVLAVAPRPLWVGSVLVLPAIALAAVPWAGTTALAAFAVVSIVPLLIAWWVAIGQRQLRYTVSPTRTTLRVSTLGAAASEGDDPDPDIVELDDVDEIAAVPLRGRVAVRFRRNRTAGPELGSAPRVVLVPDDRWPGVAAACARADISLPWGEPPTTRPPLSLIATVAVSGLVPIAGIAVGIGLGVQWLL